MMQWVNYYVKISGRYFNKRYCKPRNVCWAGVKMLSSDNPIVCFTVKITVI